MTTAMEMVAAAKARVPAIGAEEARGLMGRADVLVVDVRDAPEVAASGKLKGAVNVSRGMLEFRADPAHPYHDAAFDPAKTVLLYCASGGRSALAAVALQELGYRDVRNLGAFQACREAGLETEGGG